MATITKRKNAYLIRCFLGRDIHGKQIIKSMTWKIPAGMSEKKAEKEVVIQAAIFEENVRNESAPDNSIRLADFIDRWLIDYAEINLKPRTVASYRDSCKRIKEEIGHIKLGNITPTMIINFHKALRFPIEENRYLIQIDLKSTLKQRSITQKTLCEECNMSKYMLLRLTHFESVPYDIAFRVCEYLSLDFESTFELTIIQTLLSDKTIQNYHGLLSSILGTAVMWQLIPSNPASRVARPKATSKKPVYLDENEAKYLLNVLEEEPLVLKTAIITLLFTGMRRGECLGLNWSDINMTDSVISINKALLYLPGIGTFIDTPKNDSSVRSIKVPSIVTKTLEEWKQEQDNDWLDTTIENNPNGWIFTKPNGNFIQPDYLTRWFGNFIKRNNIKPIHLHSLRHSNASLQIANNVNIQTVSHRLGHSSTTTTSKIYSHMIASADAKASDVLEDILTIK